MTEVCECKLLRETISRLREIIAEQPIDKSEIGKLKRENEMLRGELLRVRDAYQELINVKGKV
jgi:SMC interacting uncharacterized protein involved in chromosome segregation